MRVATARKVRPWSAPFVALAVVVAGCHSLVSSPRSIDARSSVQATGGTSERSAETSSSPKISIRSAPTASTSATALTGASCTRATARAVAAVVPQLPTGTSAKPAIASRCRGDTLLDVTFPALGRQTWTVRVIVTAGTAADCQHQAAAAYGCRTIKGYASLVGSEIQCAGVPCDEGWVYGDGHLVDVHGYLSSFDPRRTFPDVPGGLPIGISVLTAITG